MTDFSPYLSDMGVASDLIPEDFIDSFSYEDGYFCHHIYKRLKNGFIEFSDRILLYARYPEEAYDQAKESVFKNLNVTTDAVAEYNGYVFYDNNSVSSFLNDYPYAFIRFAYHDGKNTLIFLGYYTEKGFDDSLQTKSFEKILTEYFGDWYDFSS